ncbi:chorismate-binding protein [Cellulomonas sp. P24]|uniref:chorismate-binding protein n=1 Tax=Cellulomonas sp. P24 TaxID=2885206 RepID=UPI00216ADEF8|nr:chorismate-binding protein [Cellulomonas sp. P24]MCR6494555.1 chorismate-binding protein [Cellulomonas sp. P24]
MTTGTGTADATDIAGQAWFAGRRASTVVECVDLRVDAARVAAGGFWAVVGDFSGAVRAWRFGSVEREAAGGRGSDGAAAPSWQGPQPDAWSSSLDRSSYVAAVDEVRAAIRDGDVYQANICRVLSARLAVAADGTEPSAEGLAAVLAAGNPAPYAGGVHVPAASRFPPVWVVTASPELFVRLDHGFLTSGPIKGTATTPEGLTEKDEAENVMITDLVRNDLQRVCVPGTVEVVDLLAREQHPGMVHLVSRVRGRLSGWVAASPELWAHVLDATYPPASVSGAPKHAALEIIERLEPVDRGPYCGVVGWIDSDAGRAELAVGIRTFWWEGPSGSASGTLRFGTGAGITWGSEAGAEWAETELKARRLVALASGAPVADAGDWRS